MKFDENRSIECCNLWNIPLTLRKGVIFGMNEFKNGPENGSMATNMEEVKQLGKQMDRMRDNKELEEDNRVSDPAQSEDTSSMKKREND